MTDDAKLGLTYYNTRFTNDGLPPFGYVDRAIDKTLLQARLSNYNKPSSTANTQIKNMFNYAIEYIVVEYIPIETELNSGNIGDAVLDYLSGDEEKNIISVW